MQNFKVLATILILTAAVSSFYGCKRTINPALTDQFVKAAYDGEITKVKKLYDEGADINAESKSNYGHTALTTSANSGKIEVVEFLLKKGVDVNQKNGMKSSALSSALTGGKVEMVKLLISKGANVNESDGNGNTHLKRLEQWQKDYPTVTQWPELIEILKKAGAK
jgi:ankyrin repeat protein